jgi:selT/selW/selH-like putative selenoprotein
VGLAAELRDDGHAVDADAGSTGQFDVVADGELLFSKHQTGRFPEPAEIRQLLAS